MIGSEWDVRIDHDLSASQFGGYFEVDDFLDAHWLMAFP